MTTLTKPQLIDIANGATFLGCGGGWPRYSALSVLGKFPGDATVDVVSVDQAAQSDKLTVMIAYLGAPTAAKGLEDVTGALRAFDLAQDYARTTLDKEIGHVIPVEIGALNTIAPCLVASARGIPVVDGDGAGRAVPSLPMTTFAGQVTPNPMIMTNSGAYKVTLSSLAGADQADAMARYLIEDPEFNDIAGLAMWIMNGATLAKAVPIRGTLMLAQGVGETLRTAKNPANAVIEYLALHGRPAFSLFNGTLTGEAETAQGGFDIGQTVFRNTATGEEVVVYDENENLMAWSSTSTQPMALAPDSICYVTEGGMAFSNADVDYYKLVGQEASIIGVRSCTALRNDEGVMASFRSALISLGYAGAYLPLEALQGEKGRSQDPVTDG